MQPLIHGHEPILDTIDQLAEALGSRHYTQCFSDHAAGYITSIVAAHTIGNNPQSHPRKLEDGIFIVRPDVPL
jgi:hypothetical protein